MTLTLLLTTWHDNFVGDGDIHTSVDNIDADGDVDIATCDIMLTMAMCCSNSLACYDALLKCVGDGCSQWHQPWRKEARRIRRKEVVALDKEKKPRKTRKKKRREKTWWNQGEEEK